MAQTQADFSVQFGRGNDLESQASFPYIYTFINNDDPASLLHGVSSAYVTVPRSSSITKFVTLDPDYNFKLLNIKYSALMDYEGHPESAYYVADQSSYGLDPDMEAAGIPATHFVELSLSFAGSGSEFLYGGANTQPQISGNGASRIPIPVNVLQGYDYGFLTVRTPRLLPMRGAMIFEITNTWAYGDIYVAAAIYGIKIRV